MKGSDIAPDGWRQVVLPTGLTLLVQTLTAMSTLVPAVLAPVAAREVGAAPQAVGILAGLVYLAAMFSGLVCSQLMARIGSLRVCQLAVLCAAAGLALGATGTLAGAIACALLAGTGHGIVNPVSSHILSRATPPRMMSLVFSIKQTGIPIGAALAGTVIPLLLLSMSWRSTALVLAASCVGYVLLMQFARGRLDDGRSVPPPFDLPGMLRPVGVVWAHPPLLALAVVSLVYSGAQIAMLNYLVSYLNLELGYTLVVAGLIFSSAQAAGVCGRIAWGAMADRFVPPVTMLIALGAVGFLCGIAAWMFTPAWPAPAIVAVCVIYGASAVGWNGVYLALVARTAPAGKVGEVTGGAQFFTFAGALAGPVIYGAIASASGSYALAFLPLSMMSLAGVVILLAMRGRYAR